VEVACSEQEGVGRPDEEAFFASQEGVKRPTVLATGTGLYKKSGSGSLRMWGGWSFRRRGALCLTGRSEATEHSSRWN